MGKAVLYSSHYSSPAKEPKKILLTPETLASFHVALDFHGCSLLSFSLESSLAGEEFRVLRRSIFKGSEASASGLFHLLAAIGMTYLYRNSPFKQILSY